MSIGSLGSSSQNFRDFLGGSQQDIGKGLQDILSTYQNPNGNFNRLENRSAGMFDLSTSEYGSHYDADAQNSFSQLWLSEYRAILQLRAEALKKKLSRSYGRVLDRSMNTPLTPTSTWAPQANREQNDIPAFNSQQLPAGVTGVTGTPPGPPVTIPDTYAHNDWFSGSSKKSTGEAYQDLRRYFNLKAPLVDIDGDDEWLKFDDASREYRLSGGNNPGDTEENFGPLGDMKDSGDRDDAYLENNVGPSTDYGNFGLVGGTSTHYWYDMLTDATSGDKFYNALNPQGSWDENDPTVTGATAAVLLTVGYSSTTGFFALPPSGTSTKYVKFAAGTTRFDLQPVGNSKMFSPYGDASEDFVGPADDWIGGPGGSASIQVNSNLTDPNDATLPEKDVANVNAMPSYQSQFVDSWMEARSLQRREAQIEAAYQAYVEGSAEMTATGLNLSYEKRMDLVFSAIDGMFQGGSGGSMDFGGGDSIDVSGSMSGAPNDKDMSLILPYGDYKVPPASNPSNPVGTGTILGETGDFILESDTRPIDETFMLKSSTAILTGESTKTDATSFVVNDTSDYSNGDWISISYKRNETIKNITGNGVSGGKTTLTLSNTTSLVVGQTLMIEHPTAGITAAGIQSIDSGSQVTLTELINTSYLTGGAQVYHTGQEYARIDTATVSAAGTVQNTPAATPRGQVQTTAAITNEVAAGDFVTISNGTPSQDQTMRILRVDPGNILVFGEDVETSLSTSLTGAVTVRVEKLVVRNATRTAQTGLDLMIDSEARDATIGKIQTVSVGAGFQDLGTGDKLIIDATGGNAGANLAASAPGATAVETNLGQLLNGNEGTFMVNAAFYRDAGGNVKNIALPTSGNKILVNSGATMYNPATRIRATSDANIAVGDRIIIPVTAVGSISGTAATNMTVSVSKIITQGSAEDDGGLAGGQVYYVIDPLDRGMTSGGTLNEYVDAGSFSGTVNTVYGHGRAHNTAQAGKEDSRSVYQQIYDRLNQGAGLGNPNQTAPGADVTPSTVTPAGPAAIANTGAAGADDGALLASIPFGAADGAGQNVDMSDPDAPPDNLQDLLGQTRFTTNMNDINKYFVGRQWDHVPGVDGAGADAVKYEADLIASHVLALPGWYGGSSDGLTGSALLTLTPPIDGTAIQQFAANVNWGKIDDAIKAGLGGSFLRVGGASDAAGLLDIDGSSSKYNVGVGFGIGAGGLFWGHTSAIGRLSDLAQLSATGPIISTMQTIVNGVKAVPGLGSVADMSIFPNIGIAGFNFDFNIPIPIPMPTGPVTFLNIPLTVVGGASFDYMTWFFKTFLENLKYKVLDSVSVYSYATTGGYAMDSYGMRGEYKFTEMGALESLRTFPSIGPIAIGEVVAGFMQMFTNSSEINQAGSETVEDRTMLYKHSYQAPEMREIDTGAFFTTTSFLSQFGSNVSDMEYSYWTAAHQNEEVANMDMVRALLVSGKELIKAATKSLFGTSGQNTNSVTGMIVNTILNMLLGSLQDSIATGILWDLIFHDQGQKGFSVPINITKSRLQSEGYDFLEDDLKLFEGDFEGVTKGGVIKNLVGSFNPPRQQLDGLANTRRYKPGSTGVDVRAGREEFGNATYTQGPLAGQQIHRDPVSGVVDQGWDIHDGFWDDSGLGDINEVYIRRNKVKWNSLDDGFDASGPDTVTTEMHRYVGSQNRIMGRGYDGAKPLDLTNFSTGYFADKYFGSDIGTGNIDKAITIDGRAATLTLHGGKNYYRRKDDYSLNVTIDGQNIDFQGEAALAPTLGGRIKLGSIDQNDAAEVIGKDSQGNLNALNQELYRHMYLDTATASNARLVKEYRDVFNYGLLDHIFISSSANTPMGGGLTSAIHMNFKRGQGQARVDPNAGVQDIEEKLFKNMSRGQMEIYLDSYFAFRRKAK